MSQTKARKMIRKIGSPGAAPHIRIHDRERIHIFIVDDDCEARVNAASPLVNSGFTVHFFVRAAECLRQLSDEACDLIIAESRMSDMDGLTFLKRTKRMVPWIPILLVSHSPEVATVVTAIKLGAEDFLEKPIKSDVLNQKIEAILQRYDAVDAGILTKMEKTVLTLILDARGNKEIAYKLKRSMRSVERHRSAIMHKLQVDNIVHLVKKTALTNLEAMDHRNQRIRVAKMM